LAGLREPFSPGWVPFDYTAWKNADSLNKFVFRSLSVLRRSLRYVCPELGGDFIRRCH
jgi:hypothetical protein